MEITLSLKQYMSHLWEDAFWGCSRNQAFCTFRLWLQQPLQLSLTVLCTDYCYSYLNFTRSMFYGTFVPASQQNEGRTLNQVHMMASFTTGTARPEGNWEKPYQCHFCLIPVFALSVFREQHSSSAVSVLNITATDWSLFKWVYFTGLNSFFSIQSEKKESVLVSFSGSFLHSELLKWKKLSP